MQIPSSSGDWPQSQPQARKTFTRASLDLGPEHIIQMIYPCLARRGSAEGNSLEGPLAHHTDIGIAQWRLPVDLDWLDWLIVKPGTQGSLILKSEPFADMKCPHAGGEAKWWLANVHALGMLDRGGYLTAPTSFISYQKLASDEYHFPHRRRKLLRKLGYSSAHPNTCPLNPNFKS